MTQFNVSILAEKRFETLGHEALGRVESWLQSTLIDTQSKQEVWDLLQRDQLSDLRERFYRDLEFGTGGLRGVMGPGTNRMNRYVVARATQGFANYIIKHVPSEQRKVAVAHDSRHGAQEFVHAVAGVLAANGIACFLYPTLQTTPQLSYAVRALGCTGGICVTASHNPPEYNGFKVYWQDGAQIIPPQDQGILAEVFALKSWDEVKLFSFAEARASGRVHDIGPEVTVQYSDAVKSLQFFPDAKKDLKIVYTPLHGTGALPARRELLRWGFTDLVIVPEQEQPDGSFPTVKKPNPEEPAALGLAIALAQKTSADVVMATDPDSDRLALAVFDPESARGLFAAQAVGDYVLLNGNQTGALLVDHVLSCTKAKGGLGNNDAVIKTIVTSEMLARICDSYGIKCFDTLTGFKWIAGLLREWEQKKTGLRYLFGTEESFGYMPADFVRDKDGIAALCQVAEMCALLKNKGRTACQRLLELFYSFGSWQEDLFNVDLVGEAGAKQIAQIMGVMRETPFVTLGGAEVVKIHDYKVQTTASLAKGTVASRVAMAQLLPVSDVLQFEMADGSRVSARPSGTEPKLKFYISVCSPGTPVANFYPQSVKRVKEIRAELEKFVGGIVGHSRGY